MSLKTALAWYWVLTFGIPFAVMGCVLVVALIVTNFRVAWRVVTHQPIVAIAPPPSRPISVMPLGDIRSVLAIAAGIGVLGLMIWTIPQTLQVLLICRRLLIGQ